MPKPTLQEIAAMPYPASLNATRKWYEPEWGMPAPDEEGTTRKYRVRVDYTVTRDGSETFEVEAVSIAAAKKAAEEIVKDCTGGDVEIDYTTIVPDGALPEQGILLQ